MNCRACSFQLRTPLRKSSVVYLYFCTFDFTSQFRLVRERSERALKLAIAEMYVRGSLLAKLLPSRPNSVVWMSPVPKSAALPLCSMESSRSGEIVLRTN